MDIKDLHIKAITEQDRQWILSLLCERWCGSEIISRGRVHHADQLAGFMARDLDRPVGVITYVIQNGDCEIVSLDSLESDRGIGSALVRAVVDLAGMQQCKRVWLITTNDNIRALGFYQKMGFRFAAIHCDVIKEYRKIKPGIPEEGYGGIPIRDEIELEISI